MKAIKLFLVIALLASVSMGQTINISGIVKDSADVGIEGAIVKLENAGIITTTLKDGCFTLNGIPTNNQRQNPARLSNGTIFTLSNGHLHFSINERSVVEIEVSNLQGRIILSLRKTIDAGPHSLSLPAIGSGINIFRVKIGDDTHVFKAAISGPISSISSMTVQGATGALSKQSRIKEQIDDVIVVIKAGYLTYRMNVSNSDTNGILIIMIPSASTVTDIDGNEYQTVIIGNQEWTVENLRTTRYNDSTPIPHVPDSSAWSALSTPGYCYYDNDSVLNTDKYGALYNWYAVDTKKLAPTGWRVPTDADWTELEDYLIANGYNWDSTTSGNKIAKSLASKTYWATFNRVGAIGYNSETNNASVISALPGGIRSGNGYFGNIGYHGGWWSATENDAGNAWIRGLGYGYDYLGRLYDDKGWGFSVRLLRD